MKKKTAITLGALALLAAGVTFGGFKIKEKKEKDKIEKTLKTVLIPNAEKELDALTKQYSDLSDSIAYYENQIEALTQDTLISEEDAEIIDKLLSDIKKDWEKAYNKWSKKYFDIGYLGDRAFDENLLPIDGKKQYFYLSGGIFKKFANDSSWYIPGYTEEYFAGRDKSGYRKVLIGRGYEYYDYTRFASSEGYDTYFESVIGYLKESLSQREDFNFYEQQDLLNALEALVKNIDNSQGIIKPETLQKLGVIVKTLLGKAEHNKLTKAKGKKESFSIAKNNLWFRQVEAERNLKNYKSPDIVNRMYREQRKK